MCLEPIFAFPFVENNLEGAQPDRQQAEANVVHLDAAGFLTPEPRRVRDTSEVRTTDKTPTGYS